MPIVAPDTGSRKAASKGKKGEKKVKSWGEGGLDVAENRILIDRLRNKDFSTLEILDLRGKIIPAKIDSVYDGDTITVGFLYGTNHVEHKLQLRFHGCDAPEMIPRNVESERLRELEKRAAAFVASELKNLIVAHTLLYPSNVGMVWIEGAPGKDKYRRILAIVKLMDNDCTGKQTGREINLTEWLISKGYAKPYFGEAKSKWTEDELLAIIGGGGCTT